MLSNLLKKPEKAPLGDQSKGAHPPNFNNRYPRQPVKERELQDNRVYPQLIEKFKKEGHKVYPVYFAELIAQIRNKQFDPKKFNMGPPS